MDADAPNTAANEVPAAADFGEGLTEINLCKLYLSTGTIRQLAENSASSLRKLVLPAGVSDAQVCALLQPLKKLQHLTVSAPRDGSSWLRALPFALRCLDVTGPGVTLPPQEENYNVLTLNLRYVSDHVLKDLGDTIAFVADLRIADCPHVTAAGVTTLFDGLKSLEWVQLRSGLSGAVITAALDCLRSSSKLHALKFGQVDRLMYDLPAAAVSRLAVDCRTLQRLFIYTSPDTCRAVVKELLNVQQEFRDSDGQPRYIRLYVSGDMFSEVEDMASASGSRIIVSTGCY